MWYGNAKFKNLRLALEACKLDELREMETELICPEIVDPSEISKYKKNNKPTIVKGLLHNKTTEAVFSGYGDGVGNGPYVNSVRIALVNMSNMNEGELEKRYRGASDPLLKSIMLAYFDGTSTRKATTAKLMLLDLKTKYLRLADKTN
ncbi:MAG: hypothetical protein NT016_03430 [Candidatus Aenigmarchaeota archaeon]|nr:hypothetical protein [Candidatus Aenigmarchaeota archaeon]